MAPRARGPLRVVGRYALYSEIAAGGMATIHLGRLLGPVGFARTVAVKRLHPQFAKDPEFVSMFLDEARLAARVQHPNVVATIDVVATDGELFLIMDYVRGESLSRLLRGIRRAPRTPTGEKTETRCPPRIAAAIMCGFLHGLHAAHEAKNERGEPLGLVHRDVSPQNVLVGADGIARVLDFVIAEAAGRIQVTRDGQIKGKLAYMPPEQLAGRELTRAVDIYASAVVMWETLTGERLFKGETEGETLAKILRDPVPAPSTIVPTLPKAFDVALLRALSREPAERHKTARELALELERCMGIASPTEVGEWVEEVVGPVLSAREDQIALIESESAALRIEHGERTFDTDSDSDMSGIPLSSRALPPSGTMPMSQRAFGVITPVAPISVSPVSSHRPADRGPLEESTGSKSTGTALALPVDKKLPVLATVAGLLVLLVVVGLVIAGRFASDPAEKTGASPSASHAGSAAPMVSVVTADPPTSPAIPPPPVIDIDPPATSVAATASAPPKPKPTFVAPPPPPPPRPTAQPTAKKNCDPPYTIDANGRKHYKLDCM